MGHERLLNHCKNFTLTGWQAMRGLGPQEWHELKNNLTNPSGSNTDNRLKGTGEGAETC